MTLRTFTFTLSQLGQVLAILAGIFGAWKNLEGNVVALREEARAERRVTEMRLHRLERQVGIE